MIVIPFSRKPGEFRVFIGLEQENIDRIKEYDPAEVEPAKMSEFSKMRCVGVLVGFVTGDDIAEFMKLGPEKGLKYLTRGWKFRPEEGDHDGPYLSYKKGTGPAN